jgi:hypothetical protein
VTAALAAWECALAPRSGLATAVARMREPPTARRAVLVTTLANLVPAVSPLVAGRRWASGPLPPTPSPLAGEESATPRIRGWRCPVYRHACRDEAGYDALRRVGVVRRVVGDSSRASPAGVEARRGARRRDVDRVLEARRSRLACCVLWSREG